eukprot:1064764-Amorphochlora_amoeboformis.AAC.1
MSTPARRRLMRDLKRFKMESPKGVLAYPSIESALNWHAIIFGPDDTPWVLLGDFRGNCENRWEGGVFRLVIHFTEEYPNKPPEWSPMMNVTAVLRSIQSLLTDPNPDSPANNYASRLFVQDRVKYSHQVMRHVELSWGLDTIGIRSYA